MKNLIGVATLQLYRKIYAFSEKVVNMFSTRFYPKFSNLAILARGGTKLMLNLGGAILFLRKKRFFEVWVPPLNFRCGFDKNFLYLFFAILRGGTRGGTSDTEVIFWPKKAVKLYWDLGMWLKIAPPPSEWWKVHDLSFLTHYQPCLNHFYFNLHVLFCVLLRKSGHQAWNYPNLALKVECLGRFLLKNHRGHFKLT